MPKRVLIIGGGIAGLQIGALIANSKKASVEIFEKTGNIGGRAMVIEKEGFKLDFGGHPIRFGPNSAIAETFNELNRPLSFIKPGPVIALLKDGTKDIFPSGGIGAIFKTKMVPKLKTLKMLSTFIKMKEEQIRSLMDVPLRDFIEEHSLDSRLVRYLKMTSAALMVSPFLERVSAGELIDNVKEVLKKGSVYYPRGGWSEIFKRLKSAIEDNGGIIHLNTPVKRIIIEKDGDSFKAIGVETDTGPVHGDLVICTVPVQQIFPDLVDPSVTEPEFVEKCRNLRPTSGIAVDFALKRPISDIDGIMMIEDPPGFGFIPSNLSPEIVPEGKSLMTFFIPLNKEDVTDKDKAKENYNKLRGMVIKHFPDLEDNLLFERVLHLPMVDGVECAYDQHRFKRPGHKIPGVENLFLAGDSAGGKGSGGDIGHTSVRECWDIVKSDYL